MMVVKRQEAGLQVKGFVQRVVVDTSEVPNFPIQMPMVT